VIVETKVSETSLPGVFLDRLAKILGAAWSEIIEQSFYQPKSAAFRVNRLLAVPDDACRDLLAAGLSLTPLSWLPEGFVVPAVQRSDLTRHRLVETGQIYVHNPSSMLAAYLLAPQPGETVMDLAAAPGGKTLHLAALMGGTGFLSAVEPVRSRFYKLKDNLRRGGAAFVRTYQLDGRQVPAKTGPRFDRVLLDAPCSGEARFHISDPESFRTWSPRKVRECRGKQLGLIQAGFASLKPGGRMLYGTCSFAPEENEAVVASLVREQPSCRLLELELPIENWQPGLTSWEGESFPESVGRCRRVLPNAVHDAMFLALIEKSRD
jgi:16S rRNA C967 or C1407 C5-methylase (RsmB/RsmF family)